MRDICPAIFTRDHTDPLGKLKVPGVQLTLFPHQIVGIWWCLKQQDTVFRSGVIGDEMGFGKVYLWLKKLFFEFWTNSCKIVSPDRRFLGAQCSTVTTPSQSTGGRGSHPEYRHGNQSGSRKRYRSGQEYGRENQYTDPCDL